MFGPYYSPLLEVTSTVAPRSLKSSHCNTPNAWEAPSFRWGRDRYLLNSTVTVHPRLFASWPRRAVSGVSCDADRTRMPQAAQPPPNALPGSPGHGRGTPQVHDSRGRGKDPLSAVNRPPEAALYGAVYCVARRSGSDIRARIRSTVSESAVSPGLGGRVNLSSPSSRYRADVTSWRPIIGTTCA